MSKKGKKSFIPIGKVESFGEIDRGVSLEFEKGKGKVLVYSPKLIRVIINQNDFDLDHSYAVIKDLEEWTEVKYQIEENSDEITLTTEELIVQIVKNPYKVIVRQNKDDGGILMEDLDDGSGACFHVKETNVRSYKKMRDRDHFYGFGEKTGPLDKKGERLVMDSGDFPYWGDKDPLYQSHPFFITLNSGIGHAIFFDNISKTTFDMGKSKKSEYHIEAATGDLNYYFIYGPSIDEILDTYTELTGRMELPPKWAVGYHQCRYSYRNEEEINEITAKFRQHQIPCDVIWFDIHYMHGYRCFTFNKYRFPDPKRLMGELKEKGFHSVVIVDPGIKVDEDYTIYQELIQNNYFTPKENGKPSYGWVWPGLTHFPDFTKEEVREWWAEKHKFYFDLGVDGIWNDMNEPAFSINPLQIFLKRLNPKDMFLDNQERHTNIRDCKNIYALCENWGTWLGFKKFKPNKRHFILTRSGFCGIQRYSAIWTGDNWTNWKNITIAVRMCVNLNLSAQVFVGPDIGGHVSLTKMFLNRRERKQFIRWIQSGVFYPFCRVHTTAGTPTQDPFSYGGLAQSISKKYIELRYELFPYWYTLFYEAHSKGKPILRPLFYETPDDEKCHEKTFENEFFLGKDILIVPIDKKNIKRKRIYLPEGSWIHYWTQEEFKGKQEHVIPITLEDIPIFVRKGAIIPTQTVLQHVGEKPIDTLSLKIYKGESGTSTMISIYEDDGETMDYQEKESFCILDVKCEYGEKESKVIPSKLRGNYNPTWKHLKYQIFDKGAKIKEEIMDIL